MKRGRLVALGGCFLVVMACLNQTKAGAAAVFATPFRVGTSQTFYSVGLQDGWVLESSEDSNRGWDTDSVSTSLRVGDDSAQCLSISEYPLVHHGRSA